MVASAPLSDEETELGWELRGDVAYSPIIESTDSLKFQRDGLEFPGYDEWYVFETRRNLGRVYQGNYFEFQPARGEILVFVNSPAFVLHDPEPYMPGILDIFWNQLEIIEPETFIADGQDCLTLVSRVTRQFSGASIWACLRHQSMPRKFRQLDNLLTPILS